MTKTTTEQREEIVVKFAGDSGDGMQLTGDQFANTTALFGNDIATFPDFPAEIRAPQGTLFGVSGFQLHFGSREIYTPGDQYDVLVAMNAAALKTNLPNLKKGGVLIVNTDGFSNKNLKMAGYEENPVEKEDELSNYTVHKIDIAKLTKESLNDVEIDAKSASKCRNMFVLGYVYWLYSRPVDNTLQFIQTKFASKPILAEANQTVLKAGYNYGETVEASATRFEVQAASLPSGTYRSIKGNQAMAYGLITGAKKAGLPLFYGSYPITPASEILHELAKHKNFGVQTFQAEDEIAAVGAAIGAAYGGHLAITGSSGPGIALKTEAIGLATMLELPLVIVNVQRGGPSTGMPTKTEQADLLQALYGRNGECPIPVLAAQTPSDCYHTAIEAARIAVECMMPVMILSDTYIANGSEPWKIPDVSTVEEFKVQHATEANSEEGFLPYKRDEKLSRPWAVPGTKGLEHRLGGIAKQHETGNVSYDPRNNEYMIQLRQQKVDLLADTFPKQVIDAGPAAGKLLILSWGSTYGVVKAAVRDLLEEGADVAHTHLRYLNPLPKDLGEILKNYDKILIPEMNNGQLIKVIRATYLIDAIPLNKVQGLPFFKNDLLDTIKSLLFEG